MNSIRFLFKLFFPMIYAAACLCSRSLAAEPNRPQPLGETVVTHVAPREAQKLIAEQKLIIVDVRTPGEFKVGHIAGATNVDFLGPDFERRVAALDKSKPCLVHCASGGRSTRCLTVLKQQHFQSVYHLDGGIKAWEKAGLPVEK